MFNLSILELIKIADSLDAKGFCKEAEEIDNLICSAAVQAKNIQHLITILKDTFTEAVNNPGLPNITKETLPDIFTVLSAIEKEVSVPYAQSPEAAIKMLQDIQDEAKAVGEGILNLENEIKQSELKLSVADPSEKAQIEKEIRDDRNRLEKLRQEANTWKTGKRPGDKEKWQRLQALFLGRGK